MPLEGRVAVFTGATGGPGRAVSARLAAAGASLALFSTSVERLERLASALDLPPDRRMTSAFDLSERAGAQEAAEATIGRFGRVDILIHAIGGSTGRRPLGEVSAGDVVGMLQLHLWTTFHVTQAFVPHLMANGWGRVIAMSSPFASNPPAYHAPYAIGKAAEEALVMTLARELWEYGVTANVLQIGSINMEDDRDQVPTADQESWTTPEEIAAVIMYLCSDEARIVTGARIPMYGLPPARREHV